MAALGIGDTLLDRYRIVSRLGAGGMGVIWEARDLKLGRRVALKVLAKERVGDPTARARMLREARAAARLEHPNAIQVHDVGEMEGGGVFLVLELVRGRSVRELMRDGLEREEQIRILRQLAEVLDAAHEDGLVHRDVKPDNVMVRDDGRVVLLDFGLARTADDELADTAAPDDLAILTRPGAIVGTPAYLAPEQARGNPGPPSDRWALAVMAFEMLTGVLPWSGTDATQLLAQILLESPRRPSEVGGLECSADAVFERALQRDPDSRFESSRELVEAIASAIEGHEPAPEQAPEPASSAATPPTPAPTFRFGWVHGATVLALALAGVWYGTRDTPEPPPDATSLVAPPRSTLAAGWVLACPMIGARTAVGSEPWLGAAASDLACRRALLRMGGEAERVRGPAHLLGLPALLADDYPPDPYLQPEAAERTLEAAQNFDVRLQGSVRSGERDGSFVVEFRAVGEGGVRGRAQARADTLHQAVWSAIDQLFADGSLEGVDALSAAAAEWTGQDLEGALFDQEFAAALDTGVGVTDYCRRAAEGATGPEMLAFHHDRCRSWTELPEAATVQVDRSSAGALALTSVAAGLQDPEADVLALAESLREAREGVVTPRGRSRLRVAEALLRLKADQSDTAQRLLRAAIVDDPTGDAWFELAALPELLLSPTMASALLGASAWQPARSDRWVYSSWVFSNGLGVERDVAQSLERRRRAYVLAPAVPAASMGYGAALASAGRSNDALALATSTAEIRPYGVLTSRYVEAMVHVSAYRYGRAFDALREAVMTLDQMAQLSETTQALMLWLVVGRILGRSEEAADAYAERFVLSEPHRLSVIGWIYEINSINACLQASPSVRARCIARLRSIRERTGMVALLSEQALVGAERYVEGDLHATIEAWRPIAPSLGHGLPVWLFDEAGEHALASQIDARLVAGEAPSLAKVREAERAEAAGDIERARGLATGIIEAWTTADVIIPAVARMRALLARSDEP